MSFNRTCLLAVLAAFLLVCPQASFLVRHDAGERVLENGILMEASADGSSDSTDDDSGDEASEDSGDEASEEESGNQEDKDDNEQDAEGVDSEAGTLNIYGEPLKRCDTSGTAVAGSSQSDGTCDETGGGVHSLCVSALPGNFSSTTGQGDWTESEAGKPWCVCIGAWSLYHAKGNDAQAHCDAIPAFVLGKEYIDNWSTWNGDELDDQIVDGIDVLYKQCFKGKSGKALSTLNSNYCSVATAYHGKVKSFSSTHEYQTAGCK